ncbi:MAG TPA: phosphodiester glycosidase family protein, partial [Chitinophagaceae bacterium]
RKTFRKKGDSITIYPVYNSAIGISNDRKADVAWIKTDSTKATVKATQRPVTSTGNLFNKKKKTDSVGVQIINPDNLFKTWKMETAIGGGPVLLQNGQIKITNDEERMFMGKAIHDKHPRTAMGYTTDNKLIILVVEGRNPQASGASLIQLAQILKDLGCVEALNLDGGGSSCLLINGKETIRPSDKTGQRPVPAVFIIHQLK